MFSSLSHPDSEDTHSPLTTGKTRLAHFEELVSEAQGSDSGFLTPSSGVKMSPLTCPH